MDLAMSHVLQTQQDLYELHKHEWNPRVPKEGMAHILYMVEEIGEVISILKKKGSDAVAEDPSVRDAFLEEMVDVMMYYSAILLCYGISAQELAEAFDQKHAKNIRRNFSEEYKELYHG